MSKSKLLKAVGYFIILAHFCFLWYPLYSQTLVAVRYWSTAGGSPVGADNKLTVFISYNSGVTWIKRGIIDSVYTGGDVGIGMAINPCNEKWYVVFQKGQNSYTPWKGAYFYCSQDTGLTWEKRGQVYSEEKHDVATAGLAIYDDTTIYTYIAIADTESVLCVYESVDEGWTWFEHGRCKLSPGFWDSDPEGNMLADSSGNLYIIDGKNSDYGVRVAKSVDWGENWDVISQVPTVSDGHCRITSLTYSKELNKFFASTWSWVQNIKVYSSSDCTSWTFLSELLTPLQLYNTEGAQVMCVDDNENVYLLAWHNSMDTECYVSVDQGLNWTFQGAIPGHSGSWATGISICSYPQPWGVDEDEEAKVWEMPAISFEGGNITLSIVQKGIYSLTIYDMIGRKLKEPLKGKLLFPGEYSINPGTLSNGVYFAHLDSDNESKYIKFWILK